jgi:stress response protein YsnF
VARIEVYEETPEIRKEAFVREEVKISKVVDHETVEAQKQFVEKK